MRISWKLFVLSCLLIVTGLSTVQAQKITLATLEWPPYVGKSLPGYGISAAIVKKALAQAGYEVEIKFMPWARVLATVKAGQYDAAFPAYYTKERSQLYMFSKPFLAGPLCLIKRKGSPIQYKTLRDLAPYRIGVIRGYANTPEFDAATFLKKDITNTDELNIKKLLHKRVDLIVGDKLSILHIINTTMPEAKGQVEFLTPPLQEKKLYLIFSRAKADSGQKLEAFNQALDTMQADGTLQRILSDYGFD